MCIQLAPDCSSVNACYCSSWPNHLYSWLQFADKSRNRPWNLWLLMKCFSRCNSKLSCGGLFRSDFPGEQQERWRPSASGRRGSDAIVVIGLWARYNINEKIEPQQYDIYWSSRVHRWSADGCCRWLERRHRLTLYRLFTTVRSNNWYFSCIFSIFLLLLIFSSRRKWVASIVFGAPTPPSFSCRPRSATAGVSLLVVALSQPRYVVAWCFDRDGDWANTVPSADLSEPADQASTW